VAKRLLKSWTSPFALSVARDAKERARGTVVTRGQKGASGSFALVSSPNFFRPRREPVRRLQNAGETPGVSGDRDKRFCEQLRTQHFVSL